MAENVATYRQQLAQQTGDLQQQIVLENYASTRWLARVLSQDAIDYMPEPT
jgi:hypothetical protein